MAAADLSRQSVMASWRHSAHCRPSHRQIVTNPDGRADVKRAFGYPFVAQRVQNEMAAACDFASVRSTRVARCGRNDDRFFSSAQRRIAALPRSRNRDTLARLDVRAGLPLRSMRFRASRRTASFAFSRPERRIPF
jgi:hypothetical protein